MNAETQIPVDLDELPPTETSFGYTGDGLRLTLTLTLPAEASHLLELLEEAADRAHESYSHGADDDAERAFDQLLLEPLAYLLNKVARG